MRIVRPEKIPRRRAYRIGRVRRGDEQAVTNDKRAGHKLGRFRQLGTGDLAERADIMTVDLPQRREAGAVEVAVI